MAEGDGLLNRYAGKTVSRVRIPPSPQSPLKNKHSKLPLKKIFLLVLSGAVLFGLYLFYLDLRIRAKFEAHRWNLPSRVYSEAFYLYPGQEMNPSLIEAKLEKLNYRRSIKPASSMGEFSRSGNKILIYLHDFSYPFSPFSGFLTELEFNQNELSAIRRLDNGEVLKTLKLEPQLIASLFDEKMEDRTLVDISQIPDDLIQGVISIEDERFYSHHGVDAVAILRAFLTDLVHLRFVQGGSTLTQQLVKNYFLTSERSLIRKVNEILMAMLLEARYSKENILEAYFNEIYFGQRGPISITGVQEASHYLFSKDVSHLSVAECALMAGMIRSPGEYSPFKNTPKAYDRRNFVLKTMKDKGIIQSEEYEQARREKILLPPPEKQRSLQAPFFVDFVQSELHANYPSDVLQSEGLRIFTTLNMESQDIAESVLQKKLADLEATKPRLKKLHEEDSKNLEGAFLAIQPQTGSIRAFVGGRDYGQSQFNRVIDAHRQPGSAFKPFVYLTALSSEGDQHFTLASTVDDTSFEVNAGGKEWIPENYDQSEHGLVTLQEALEQSYNIATSRLAMEVGLENIVEMARAAGIESPLEPYPSLALGAFEMTPLELARAYTLFPNQGTRVDPIAITSVVTRDGVVLEKKGFRMKRVVPPDVAYLMNFALRGVLDRGTASSARALGFTGLAAGKTGTTSDNKDSWFVGYTPDLLALSWVGYDDATPTGLTGASGALPIWAEFMQKVSHVSKSDFPAANNIILVKIDKSGRLHRMGCGEGFEEAFVRGTEPKENCQ